MFDIDAAETNLKEMYGELDRLGNKEHPTIADMEKYKQLKKQCEENSVYIDWKKRNIR